MYLINISFLDGSSRQTIPSAAFEPHVIRRGKVFDHENTKALILDHSRDLFSGKRKTITSATIENLETGKSVILFKYTPPAEKAEKQITVKTTKKELILN